MAETKLNDLPVTSLTDFTDNDRFIITDDGRARQLPRSTFQTWLLDNVRGEKGEQGFTGRDGIDGKDGLNGVDGKDGLDAYQIAVSLGYVGTKAQWIASLKGATGAKGADGFNGWTPQLKTTNRNTDVVLEITDWVGGTGTKPTLLGYIGETGIVTNINNAMNIRGTKGDKGDIGLTGETGANGVDGKTVASIVFNADLSATVNYTDDTSVTSNTPPVQYGWGTYKDGQYTDVSPFNIAIATQTVIPNTAAIKIEHPPTGYPSFYNPTLQKYLLTDSDGFYDVRVKFKVVASNQPSTINVSMSKATTDTPFSEDRTLRGDGKIQDMNFNTVVYGDEALATNGLTIYVKTYDRAISIYNIEVTIAKLI